MFAHTPKTFRSTVKRLFDKATLEISDSYSDLAAQPELAGAQRLFLLVFYVLLVTFVGFILLARVNFNAALREEL